MKEYREIIQFGTFYRLKSPFEGNEKAWMVVSNDLNTAYRPLQEVNQGFKRIKLLGLGPNKEYHVSINETNHYGDESSFDYQ